METSETHQGLLMRQGIKWLARNLHIKFCTIELLLSSQSGKYQCLYPRNVRNLASQALYCYNSNVKTLLNSAGNHLNQQMHDLSLVNMPSFVSNIEI